MGKYKFSKGQIYQWYLGTALYLVTDVWPSGEVVFRSKDKPVFLFVVDKYNDFFKNISYVGEL